MLKTLQTGKTPGPNGIPVEFYKQYAEDLVIRFQDMLGVSLESENLPKSMGEEIIVVIPKPGKDPSLCCSYRPTSLLNVDAKLLAKILNTVIMALIQPDQMGFMPGRGTDINIRRLFSHIDRAQPDTARVVASLDTEKAFNSIEWGYLWKVLFKFGFGPKSLLWL